MSSRNISREAPPAYSNIVNVHRPRQQQSVSTTLTNNSANSYQSSWSPASPALPQSAGNASAFYSSAIRSATIKPGITPQAVPPVQPTSIYTFRPMQDLSQVPAQNHNRNIHKRQPSTESNNSSHSGKSMPSGFTRPARVNEPTSSFSPMYLLSNCDQLSNGFPRLLPSLLDLSSPHPFKLRDVEDSDWFRFLSDMEKVALLPSSNLKDDIQPICNLTNLWNRNFFCARKLKVYLAKGPQLLAGTTNISNREAPDWKLIMSNLHRLKAFHGSRLRVEEMYRLIVVPM